MKISHHLRLSARTSHHAAFSLIEMMLVLSIMALLLGVGIKYLGGTLEAGKESRVKADLSALETGISTYELLNSMRPTTEQGLMALVKAPSTQPMPKRWKPVLDKELKDPWGMPYQYRDPGRHNPNKFDLFSLGPDKVESDDDLGNWE